MITMSSLTQPRTKPSVSGADAQRLKRFAKALRQAMIVNKISERRMAAALGITSGTTQKYFRGEVDPFKVGTGVNRGLSRLLGVSLDQLCDFYETGNYSKELSGGVGFDDVVAWMQSPAGAEHIGRILETAAAVCQRGVGDVLPTGGEPKQLEPFTWPLEELQSAGISQALQERMGLTEEVLRVLVEEGVFDSTLVEAFSVATNLDPVEVRKAFKCRCPIPSE